MSRSIRFAALIGVAIIAAARMAEAAEPARIHVSTVKVTYSDLDLRNVTDARAMLGRLERAAFKACGGSARLHPAYKLRPKLTTRVYRECREHAVTRAVATVNVQSLWVAFRDRDLRQADEEHAPRDARS